MHKLTLEAYFKRNNYDVESQAQRQEQIGLFTFYKQQEQSQTTIRNPFASKKKQSMRKAKGKSRFNFHKINQTLKQESRQQQKQTNRNTTKQSGSIVKVIEFKISDLQNTIKEAAVKQENFQNSKMTVITSLQNNFTNNNQRSNSKQLTEIKKYNLILNPQIGFTSTSLKKMDQLLQLSNPKLEVQKAKNQQGTLQNTTRAQKDLKSYSLPHYQEIVKTITNFNEGQQHSKEMNKASIFKQSQEQQIVKSFKRSFLKKIRQQPLELQKIEEEKLVKSSKTVQNLHKQNKKYFCNLLNNLYLPHNQNSQAAKMLRETLKFPNLHSKIKNYNLKTEGNSSPSSMKKTKNQHRSISCRKNGQSIIKNKAKESINLVERDLLKPASNEKFKLIVRKDIKKDLKQK